VDGTEVLVRGSDNAAAIFNIGQVRLHKVNLAAIRMQIGSNGVSPFGIAPAKDNSRGPAFHK
jgi:hypothetical protein